jgi:hypothetical protein
LGRWQRRSTTTFNHTPDIDRQWIAVAKRWLAELRSGQVRIIPANEVFARIRIRFAQ